MTATIRATKPDPFREQAIQATALLLELLDCRRLGKFDHAAKAQADLRGMGLDVRFREPLVAKEGRDAS
jgi:hypothetical protein